MLRVGAATRDITPSNALLAAGELYLCGYASDSRTFTATGVWKPISVRAFAVEDEAGKRAVLASIDVTSVSRPFTDAVVARLGGAGLTRANTVISSTHNHSSPVARDWPTWPDNLQTPNPVWFQFLQNQTVAAINAAVAALEPATLGFTRGQCDMAINRRPGGFWYDRDVDVVHAKDSGGQTIAVLFKYGCHPVSSGVSQTVTPDYPGMAREVVESELGGTAIFFQGFGGTVTPQELGEEEIADDVGAELGDCVVTLIEDQGGEPVNGSLSILHSAIDLEIGPPPVDSQLNGALTSDFPQENLWAELVNNEVSLASEPAGVTTDIHSIRIGGPSDGWHVATLSHEVVTEYVIELQQLWASERLTLIGYADSVDCYLGTQDIVARLPGVENEIPVNQDYEGSYSALWYGLPAGFTANAPEELLDHLATLDPDPDGITGTPAVLTFDDSIFAFARGVAGDVVSATNDGAGWGPLVSNAGVITGSPQMVVTDFGPVVAVRGVAGDVWISVREPAGWSDWIGLGGAITGNPSIAWTGTHVVVMVRGVDGSGWVTFTDDPSTAWSTWADITGGTITDSPSVAHASTGGLFAVARSAGPNGNILITRAFGPSAWLPWQNIQGGLVGSPVAYAAPDGKIGVFARGVDAAAWLRWAPSLATEFKQWTLLGEPTSGPPSVCRTPDGKIALAVRDEDGIPLIASAPNLPGPWSGFAPIGGPLSGGPTLFVDGDTLAFVARDTAGRLVYSSQEQPDSPANSWMPTDEWIVLS